jgi:hypothetical protein
VFGESGQAILEVALCLPVLILLAFGMIDIQWALGDAGDMNAIVTEVARCEAIGALPCTAPNSPTSYAQTQITNLHLSPVLFTVVNSGCNGAVGVCTFTASYAFKGLGPWFPAIVITRTGTASIKGGE